MQKLFSDNKKILLLFSFALTCLIIAGGIFADTVDAASLNFAAGSQYSVGQTFSVNVLVSAASGESANAVSAVASFPTDKLKLLYLNKAGTVISLWTQEPSFSNGAGTANFEGVILNPGFSGQGGKVITLTFQAKALGDATLSFANATVLANDGLGTNILTNARGITFQIVQGLSEPKIPAKPHITPVVETPVVAPVAVAPQPKIITIIDTSLLEGYLLIIVVLLILFLIFFVIGLYLYHILKEIRNRIYASIERTQQYTSDAFKALHKDIDEHLRLLHQARNKRDLTDEEEIFMTTFEKRMDQVEKEIQKELTAIKKKR